MNRQKIKSMVYISLVGAIMCVASPISVRLPLSSVPLSLATFTVYFSSAVVGAKKGTAAVLLYFLIGSAGVPVFSGYTGGVQVFFGPTGGYLFGYIFCAFFTGIFADKFEDKIYMYFMGMIIGTIFLYTIGALWYSYVGSVSLKTALLTAVLPFIPGDAVKITISSLAGLRGRKIIKKSEIQSLE